LKWISKPLLWTKKLNQHVYHLLILQRHSYFSCVWSLILLTVTAGVLLIRRKKHMMRWVSSICSSGGKLFTPIKSLTVCKEKSFLMLERDKAQASQEVSKRNLEEADLWPAWQIKQISHYKTHKQFFPLGHKDCKQTLIHEFAFLHVEKKPPPTSRRSDIWLRVWVEWNRIE